MSNGNIIVQKGIPAEMERLRKNPRDWGAISTLTTLGYNPLKIPKEEN